jgi:hypothetical protein
MAEEAASMQRYLRYVFLAAVAAAFVATPAFGAGTLTETAGVPSAITATLNGSDQTATYTLPIVVSDTRTGANANGWNLTITSTQFSTIAPVHTLPTNASTIASAPSVSCTTSCPTNSVTYPVAVPAGSGPPAAVKLFNAASGTGKGASTITPTVTVSLPGNIFTGSYTSTITLAIVAGP